MLKYIKSFLKFIIPILKSSLAAAAVEELTKVAYPPRPRESSFSRHRTQYNRMRDYAKKDVEDTSAIYAMNRRNADAFHDVLMVAFDISGPNIQLVHEWLGSNMPDISKNCGGGIAVDDFWIADDQSADDRDSAVFVTKGNQQEARELLREHGLLS